MNWEGVSWDTLMDKVSIYITMFGSHSKLPRIPQIFGVTGMVNPSAGEVKKESLELTDQVVLPNG